MHPFRGPPQAELAEACRPVGHDPTILAVTIVALGAAAASEMNDASGAEHRHGADAEGRAGDGRPEYV